MAEFRFAVHKEHLDLLTPTKGRSDNLNTTSCIFNFRTPDWEGASKWAHFINYDINNGQPYDFALINDRIPPEQGLNLPSGVWDVYVHGEVLVGNQVIGRITTNPVAIVIDVPNDTDGDPLAPIGPTVAEQIDGKATAAWNAKITSATAEIDNAVGIPSVTVNITGADGNKSLGFVFHNMKGEQGDQGPVGPAGPAGPQGEQGIRGETGITPDFSIGTVDDGATAAATITGTAEAPVLNLVLPKGDKGDTGQTGQTGATGATPDISIGTVTEGDTAAATMTGTAAYPVLNLVLPKGDKGDTGQTGATPDISIGTVTSGSTASATMTGTAAEPVLNLVLPKGDTGQTGETGADGTDGITFTPAVSSAGVISWTNDGGKQNPQSVDMVTAVINALPSAVGVEF